MYTPTPALAAVPARPIIVYRSALSGHAHRVELLLALMALPYKLVDVDLANGEHKTPEFLAMNPFGQVPVIDDNGVVLYDSNAILMYLALTYDDGRWLPRDSAGAARVQQWLSLAAGPIFNGPCVARLVKLFGYPLDHGRAVAVAQQLFATLEQQFAGRAFALGGAATIADVAAYSYIAHAPEGGLPLDAYPALRAWLGRVEALPGFVPMQRLAVAADPS